MGQQVTLKIRLWTERHGKRFPRDDSDLPDLLAEHVARVAAQCEDGYTSGQMIVEGFGGWWEIERETARRKRSRNSKDHAAYRKRMSGAPA